MKKIKEAFLHVQSMVPCVVAVVYDDEGRWAYLTESGEVPTFKGKGIDVSLLEEASDEAYLELQQNVVYTINDFG